MEHVKTKHWNEVIKSDLLRPFIFAILIILYKFYYPLDILIDFFILFLVLKSNLFDNFFILLFFSIFDEVFSSGLLGIGISKIVMIISFFKLAYYFIPKIKEFSYEYKKIPWIKSNIIILFVISIFSIIGIINDGFSMEIITFFLNVLIIILFITYFKLDQVDVYQFYRIFAKTVVYIIFIGSLYGLIHFNFLSEVNQSYSIYRFNGIYEPNFMALYSNIGLAILLFNSDLFKQNIRRGLILFFTLIVCLTVSITGVLLLSFVYIVYIFQTKKYVLNRLFNSFIACCFCFVCFFTINFGIKNYNMYKIENGNNLVEEHDNNNGKLEEESDNSIVKENVNVESSNEIQDIPDPSNFENNLEEIEINENPILSRIRVLIKDIKAGNFDKMTSGRTALIRDFYKASMDRNIISILFGNGPLPKKVYSSFFNSEKYSHNTYIDILYNLGLVGSLLFAVFVFKKTFQGNFLFKKNDIINKKISLIRLICLIAALTLTLYSRRFFLILFLL